MKEWRSYVKSSNSTKSSGKICLQHEEVIKQGKGIAGGWVHRGHDGVTILHQLFPGTKMAKSAGQLSKVRKSALSLASYWQTFEIYLENRNCKHLQCIASNPFWCWSYISYISYVYVYMSYHIVIYCHTPPQKAWWPNTPTKISEQLCQGTRLHTPRWPFWSLSQK